MRNLALGGLLILTSAAAIGYVYTNPTAPPCTTCQPKLNDLVEPSNEPCHEETGCPSCKPAVVDVVDLNTAYQTASPIPGVSFDEPPLAKPRSQAVTPTSFEEPISEVAPAPREAAEVAPAPRSVK